MAITYQDPASSPVHFVKAEFEEACDAVFVRSEDRGQADSGTRIFVGRATGLATFLSGLIDKMADHEYPGCGLEGFQVSDASGNLRRVTLTFRGLMSNARDADVLNSSVFGTFSLTDNNGQQGSVEFESPQTEYRYVVVGSRPVDPAFTGVDNPSGRPIKVWNLQPTSFGGTTLAIINRLSKFDVRPAGLAWEVSEVWTRELSYEVNDDFATSLSNVEIVDPEE